MGHNGCDGSQASGPWAIGSGYRFSSGLLHSSGGTRFFSLLLPRVTGTWTRRLVPPILPSGWHRWGLGFCPSFTHDRG